MPRPYNVNSPFWHHTSEFQAAAREPQPVPATLHEEARRQHHTLVTTVRRVAGALETDMPRDPATHAAARSARDRLADIDALAQAVADVCADVRDDFMVGIARSDGPLADYVRSLYAWALAVVRALDELSEGLRALSPDWEKLRARFKEAEEFFLDSIEADILAELEHGRATPQFGRVHARTGDLFRSAAAVREKMNQPFG